MGAGQPWAGRELRASGIRWQTEIMTGYCTEDNVARYVQRAKKLGVQFIVGVGGGRVLDTAKAVADTLEGGESITIPTWQPPVRPGRLWRFLYG
jgi:glycerol dehydrogenase/uncharacterized oxidoreductase